MDTRITQARTFLADARYDDAIDILRSNDAPNDHERCELLAEAYYGRGDTKGDVYAANYFAHRARELGDTSPRILAILATTAFRKENYHQAIEACEDFVTPDSPAAAQFVLGLSLLYTGRSADAVEWLERAAKAEPDNTDIAVALQRATHGAASGAGTANTVDQLPIGLGGVHDSRPQNVPAPYDHNALSMLAGQAIKPKDFDWLAKNIPCQQACPARTDIPEYLNAIYKGEYERAYRINLRDNVFPGVLGRVCSRPCEDMCRHGWEGLGESVGICFSKRSAADLRGNTATPIVMDKLYDDTGKRVAVIGSGVGGLATARDLALLGHSVTVLEKHSRPGGMMNQGIPVFRLPREVIDNEIEQVRLLGVDIRCNVNVGEDVTLSELADDYDAVVIAVGTLRPNILDLPGRELKGIYHGLPWLLEANEHNTAQFGERVVVIGGGFTAMDCARTAGRLLKVASKSTGGVPDNPSDAPVRVCYRRSQNEMLVTPGELEELNHEGIPMDFMVSPLGYIGDNGWVTHVQFIRTELGEPDAGGRRRPIPIEGSQFTVPADTVLLATGQFPDTSWIDDQLKPHFVGEGDWFQDVPAYQTSMDKVFLAGDCATGASTLIEAIGHSRSCARAVDQFLTGTQRLLRIADINDARETGRIREMDYVPRQVMPTIPLPDRDLHAEVETGYDTNLSVDETQRCYLCHYKYEIDSDKCIYCDWCIKAKPRPECILKVSSLTYDPQGRVTGWNQATGSEDTRLIWINQDDCIRCNACVDACPVDCISIQKVSLDEIPCHQYKGPILET